MATANVRNIRRIPGRLCINPTSTSTAFPHGGTALGLTRDNEFRFGYVAVPIRAEEWGGSTSDAVYAGESAVIVAVLREFDNDAINAIFVNTAAGSVSGDRVVTDDINTGTRAGYFLSGKAAKLLFSPISPNRHEAILLYNAIPALDETASLKMAINEEIGMPVIFYGTPDGNGKVYQIAKLEDMSLT